MDAGRPDPDKACDLGEFVALLGELIVWAGAPSHRELAKRVGPLLRPPQTLSKSTISDVFLPRRRRLSLDLVVAIVRALGIDEVDVDRWRQACVRMHASAKSGGSSGVFRQLPADLATFTGRSAEMKELVNAASTPSGDRPTTVVLSAIEGMGGVGKTRLAVHAAHELVRGGRFGDVQLYVNLRGFDPEQPPADPAEVLDGFLRALEVPGQHIPAELEDRAAMFRDRMHDKQALVLLDNAASVDQVRPLIPASPSCLVLITSRRSLIGLDEAVLHHLDVFDQAESLELLERIVGAERIAAEQKAAEAIVEFCGRLPMAVALVASQLRARPAWSLAHLLHRLTSGRQDLLKTDAKNLDGKNLQTVFDLSYRNLTSAAQRVFRLLSLHPGGDFTADATAALADVPIEEADRVLELLLDEHLLEQRAAGRYEFHDLLHGYSREVVRSEAGEPERHKALMRLFDHYRYSSATAMDLLHPHEFDLRPHPSRPDLSIGDPPVFADPEAARMWLDAETPNLVACAGLASEQSPEHATGISSILYRFLDGTARYADALTLHTAALRAADNRHDQAGLLQARLYLGALHWRLGRYPDAMDDYQRALALARETGDQTSECRALANLGLTFLRIGRYHDAITNNQEAIAIARETGNRVAEGHFLGNLSRAYHRLGRYPEALEHLDEALVVSRETGDRVVQCRTLCNLGVLSMRVGKYPQAHDQLEQSLALAGETGDRVTEVCVRCNLGVLAGKLGDHARGVDQLEQSLVIAREVGDRTGEGHSLTDLGVLYRRMGRYAESGDRQRQALVLAGELGDKNLELEVVNGLGEVARAVGSPSAAIDLHHQALVLAAELDDRFEQARARLGLGDAQCDLDQSQEAQVNWRLAHDLFADLGVPETDDARRRLGIVQQQ